MKNTATAYGTVSRSLHWLIAIAIIGLLAVGTYMEGLPDDAPQRGMLYGLHKATGALTLLLVIIRIGWIAYSPAPALPEAIPARDKKLSKAVKHLMYLLMVVAPLSGLLMSHFFGYPVDMYGLFKLPQVVETNKELAGFFHTVHGISTQLLAVCVILHIAGVIKHRRSGNPEEDVLPRMLGK
ncbi:MAG: cytochrome b [Candidatus Pelagadaptatus aseana]|uniref:cytochrome b n=1 Tax=Candidatus Pelagadaptatus aseana TaxID=3120508 RepID=UPI0039B2B7C1